MPDAKRYIESKVDEFLASLKKKRKACDATREKYRYLLLRDLNYLDDIGMAATPAAITEKEVDHLLAERWIHSEKYNFNRHELFFRFLLFHGNRTPDEYPLPKTPTERPNADWMEDHEARAMYAACVTPFEKIVIHAELKLCLRRGDLLNVTLDDVFDGFLYVLGKGNKRRSVPFVSDSREVFASYYRERCEIMRGCPEDLRQLLVYRRFRDKPHWGYYKKTAIDNLVKRVAKRAGIARSISSHTLRRTGARIWYKAGVPLATISFLLGHADIKTTIRYLGLKLDDLQAGAQLFDAYFDQYEEHGKTPAADPRQKSGEPDAESGVGGT